MPNYTDMPWDAAAEARLLKALLATHDIDVNYIAVANAYGKSSLGLSSRSSLSKLCSRSRRVCRSNRPQDGEIT